MLSLRKYFFKISIDWNVPSTIKPFCIFDHLKQISSEPDNPYTQLSSKKKNACVTTDVCLKTYCFNSSPKIYDPTQIDARRNKKYFEALFRMCNHNFEM